jgi:hypothetical protein
LAERPVRLKGIVCAHPGSRLGDDPIEVAATKSILCQRSSPRRPSKPVRRGATGDPLVVPKARQLEPILVIPSRERMPTQKNSGSQAPESGAGHVARLELFATVFGTGAAVMVVEILGTRVIGPVFGVSLFVWAALLAVTLGSLAIGYYAGGVLVDRSPKARLLGSVVAVS